MKHALTVAILAAVATLLAAAVPHFARGAPAPCSDTCTTGSGDMSGMSGMAGMPGMNHMDHTNHSVPDMTVMGPHMTMTPSMPPHPGDAQRADQVVRTLRSAIDKYRDYTVAESDGYMPFLASVPQPQYHFTNWRYGLASQSGFDPSKPTSLLYKKTATGYELVGAMYTAPRSATLADLNARIPLSVAHWHEHVNFCKAPSGAGRDAYFGQQPQFGLQGSIATADACRAAGGTFIPVLFNWMVHVYPYAANSADIWKVGH